ncbi:MAG: PqqD family protein [Thermoanaerobaculales bacterium]|nr:PqqD family protein [Thermoanaerobaculales bacterium]
MSDLSTLTAMLADDQLTTTKLVDGTGVILDVDSLQVFTLNETGMFLVEAMGEGVADRSELAARLVESFEVDEATAVSDVDAFVGELASFLVAGRPR